MGTESGAQAADVPIAERPSIVARFEHTLVLLTAGLTLMLSIYKVLLTRSLNINWDEFYFLSHVYALKRNELTFVLQSAYTHLFTWLTRLPGSEIDQISAGRLVMVLL